jgi:hypothetical protein
LITHCGKTYDHETLGLNGRNSVHCTPLLTIGIAIRDTGREGLRDIRGLVEEEEWKVFL